MLSQRALQLSTRRFAARPHALSKAALLAPSALAAQSAASQIRPATTQPESQQDGYKILVNQRLNRPVSPHLTIYKWQIPWILSITNRITGSVLSGGMYIFGAAYLAAPLFGWHLESASMAAAFGAWPFAAKLLTKMAIAFPFSFHSWNGIRHLFWDMGSQFANKQVVLTGYVVMGLTAVSTLGLALL